MPSSTGSSLRATACEKPSPKYPGLTAPDRHEPINPPTGAAARDQSERCPRSIGITARNHRNTQQVPADVTRAKAGAWLDLISPLTEWAGLKGDALRHKREMLRVQREDVLAEIGY